MFMLDISEANDIMWMDRFSLGSAVTGGSPAGKEAGWYAAYLHATLAFRPSHFSPRPREFNNL
jgi:hypothetical protein